MKIRSLKLLFLKPDWGTPPAYVAVASSTQMSIHPDREQEILLTTSCATYKELECAIDRLQAELNNLKPRREKNSRTSIILELYLNPSEGEVKR